MSILHGNLDRATSAYHKATILAWVSGAGADGDAQRRVASHIMDTGDCAWHAGTVVLGFDPAKCPCYDCEKARKIQAVAS